MRARRSGLLKLSTSPFPTLALAPSLDGNPVVGEAGSFEDIDRCGGPAAVAVDDGGSHLSFDAQFEQRMFVAGKVLVDGLRTR